MFVIHDTAKIYTVWLINWSLWASICSAFDFFVKEEESNLRHDKSWCTHDHCHSPVLPGTFWHFLHQTHVHYLLFEVFEVCNKIFKVLLVLLTLLFHLLHLFNDMNGEQHLMSCLKMWYMFEQFEFSKAFSYSENFSTNIYS